MAAVVGVFRSVGGDWRLELLADGTVRIYFLGALMAAGVYGAGQVEAKLRELGGPTMDAFVED